MRTVTVTPAEGSNTVAVVHPQWRRILAITSQHLVRNAAVASSSAAVRSRASITLAVDLQPHLRVSVQPGSG
jgi:hypothetical protein